MNTKAKTLSPLAQSALELDTDFSELERLASEIDRLADGSESEVTMARKLLARFTECSQRIGVGVQALAKNLDESRQRAERSVEIVATRATALQTRDTQTDALFARYQTLGQQVGELSATIASLPRPGEEGLSTDDTARITAQIPALNTRLVELIEEARKIQQDARTARVPDLERNADSLSQRLGSVHKKLDTFLAGRPLSH